MFDEELKMVLEVTLVDSRDALKVNCAANQMGEILRAAYARSLSLISAPFVLDISATLGIVPTPSPSTTPSSSLVPSTPSYPFPGACCRPFHRRTNQCTGRYTTKSELAMYVSSKGAIPLSSRDCTRNEEATHTEATVSTSAMPKRVRASQRAKRAMPVRCRCLATNVNPTEVNRRSQEHEGSSPFDPARPTRSPLRLNPNTRGNGKGNLLSRETGKVRRDEAREGR
eukprot:scaffold109_cov368-Pavlova_lutheri.AAC.28